MTLPDCMMPDGAEPCKGYGELRDEAERLVEMAAEQSTKIIRLQLALQILRDWHSERGWDGEVVTVVRRWIDAGMEGPIPCPTSPFFADWMEERGLSKVGGFLGYVAKAKIVSDKRTEEGNE